MRDERSGGMGVDEYRDREGDVEEAMKPITAAAFSSCLASAGFG
jgi:hypothetical protein